MTYKKENQTFVWCMKLDHTCWNPQPYHMRPNPNLCCQSSHTTQVFGFVKKVNTYEEEIFAHIILDKDHE